MDGGAILRFGKALDAEPNASKETVRAYLREVRALRNYIAETTGWDPPSRFADNEPMDPYQDIDHYEVYAREDGNFTDYDLPVMLIPALTSVDNPRPPSTGGKTSGREPLSKFPLENLNPHVSKASRQYVSRKPGPSPGVPLRPIPTAPRSSRARKSRTTYIGFRTRS